jgi:hypothetical protein
MRIWLATGEEKDVSISFAPDLGEVGEVDLIALASHSATDLDTGDVVTADLVMADPAPAVSIDNWIARVKGLVAGHRYLIEVFVGVLDSEEKLRGEIYVYMREN